VLGSIFKHWFIGGVVVGVETYLHRFWSAVCWAEKERGADLVDSRFNLGCFDKSLKLFDVEITDAYTPTFMVRLRQYLIFCDSKN
jgi:hypothetical protein